MDFDGNSSKRTSRRWECHSIERRPISVSRSEWESLLEIIAKDLVSMDHQLQDRSCSLIQTIDQSHGGSCDERNEQRRAA